VQARLPAGQGTENLRRKSATKERRRGISGPQAPTKEGLEGPERARTIRRTAAKKRRRQTRFRGSGALRRHALDPTAGREADAHQLVEAQRKPGVCLPTWRPADIPLVLSMVGGNSDYPRLAFLGATGKLPSVVVAVDNPAGIVPGCGQRPLPRCSRSAHLVALS